MKRIFTLLSCLWSLSAFSSVYVVHDIEESSARSLVFHLSELLPANSRLIPIRSNLLKSNLEHIKSNDAVVAIGVDSFSKVCELAVQGNVIAAFIGKEEYLKVKPSCTIGSSAIFSGAPLEKRLSVLQNIWLDNKPLAILYSDNLLIDQQEVHQQVADYGFTVRFYKVTANPLSTMKVMRNAMVESDLMISLTDTKLYDFRFSQSIRKLLFQNKKVIIGAFSPEANSGALFAIYSNSEEKLSSLAAYLESWMKDSQFPQPDYPKKLRVNFNSFLVRFHGIALPSPAYLKSAFELCSEAYC